MQKALPVLLEGLQRLPISRVRIGGPGGDPGWRAPRKLRSLKEVPRLNPMDRVTAENAHPHRDCRSAVVVVHNSIII